jgi:hypothetical protein
LLKALYLILLHLDVRQLFSSSLILQGLLFPPLQLQKLVSFSLYLFPNAVLLLLGLYLFAALLLLLRFFPLTLAFLFEHTLIECFLIALGSLFGSVAFVCRGGGSRVVKMVGGLHYNDSNAKKLLNGTGILIVRELYWKKERMKIGKEVVIRLLILNMLFNYDY